MTSIIESAPHATQRSSSIEAYLSLLVKQGFLDKIRLGSSGAPQPTQGMYLICYEINDKDRRTILTEYYYYLNYAH